MMNITPEVALIVVDVQIDFCPGGTLAVAEGHRVVPLINALLPKFHHRVFTRDWHPENHCSFTDQPEFVDKSWPIHCIADTPGARFHPALDVPRDALVVNKGTDAELEAYSGFQGTRLAEQLGQIGVRHVVVCGLATDYCVKHTALDANNSGFNVIVLEDACRPVDIPPGSGTQAIKELIAAGIAIATTKDLA